MNFVHRTILYWLFKVENRFSSIEASTLEKNCFSFCISVVTDPKVLIEGVLFRARYLGSTQLVSHLNLNEKTLQEDKNCMILFVEEESNFLLSY